MCCLTYCTRSSKLHNSAGPGKQTWLKRRQIPPQNNSLHSNSSPLVQSMVGSRNLHFLSFPYQNAEEFSIPFPNNCVQCHMGSVGACKDISSTQIFQKHSKKTSPQVFISSSYMKISYAVMVLQFSCLVPWLPAEYHSRTDHRNVNRGHSSSPTLHYPAFRMDILCSWDYLQMLITVVHLLMQLSLPAIMEEHKLFPLTRTSPRPLKGRHVKALLLKSKK